MATFSDSGQGYRAVYEKDKRTIRNYRISCDYNQQWVSYTRQVIQ